MLSRDIGVYETGREGPLFIFVAGMHGNEPAGIDALDRIFKKLAFNQLDIKGKIIGLRGNTKAIKAGTRYIDRDLNRGWNQKNFDRIKSGDLRYVEDVQQLHLQERIDSEIANHEGKVYLYDLHTTSAESCPFHSWYKFNDTKMGAGIPAPVITNIFENIHGVLLKYYGDQGVHCALFEAGKHDAESSVDRHESYVWLALHTADAFTDANLDFFNHHEVLKQASYVGGDYYQITYTHRLHNGEAFKMLPGFENFHDVVEGQVLAILDEKEVLAPSDGRIFMPLYQNDGSEGFFIIRHDTLGHLESMELIT